MRSTNNQSIPKIGKNIIINIKIKNKNYDSIKV